MPKNIVILADGTGNSAAALAKTNVWRLYRALDLSRSPPNDMPAQVAIYRDGVGTSAFRPLSLLGGIFGLGLTRNIIELYKFLCRTYEPGDRIYAFGFSRGAFTVRVLVAFILDQKLLPFRTKEELDRYAPDAYRRYRRRYKLPLFGSTKADYEENPSQHRDTTVGLVDRLRNLRDWTIRRWRTFAGQPQFEIVAAHGHQVDKVAFLGVWDTVAAYGLPLDELTRGIDEWVWPLSMPNYKLGPGVERARHALALDEERDSFRPMLWDEGEFRHPAALDGTDRLLQVWFAGVHSNVGGGYADDTLSYVPLEWMIGEAQAAGLRLNERALCEAYPPPNPYGRIYDSRAGVGGYYRYQPRRLSSLLLTPKPDTLILRDPRRKGHGFLREVLLHESVVARIANGTDHYAPVSMADTYRVVRTAAPNQPKAVPTLPAPVPAGSPLRKWLWNDVWLRRVNYFATVVVSLLLVALPAIESLFPPAACEGPQCLLSGPIHAAGAFLPGFVSAWIDAFARAPGTFLTLIVLLALLAVNGARLAVRIGDDARALWFPPQPPPPPYRSRIDRAIYGLRASPGYLKGLQYFKWRLGPDLFGALSLFLVLALPALAIDIALVRLVLRHRENTGTVCALTQASATAAAATGAAEEFPTSAACWPTAYEVEAGRRYRATLTVTRPWRDGTIDTSPAGFTNDRMPVKAKLGPLFRRSTADRWFQPILRIKRAGSPTHLQALDFACRCGGDAGRPVYEAEFVARASGRVGLFVNDAAIGLLGPTGHYYANNEGAATVAIVPLPEDTGPAAAAAPK